MKKVFCLIAIVACAACSSTKKTDTTTSTDTSTVEQKVTEATTADTTPTEEPAKETKGKKQKETAEVTTSPSADSAFPSITGTEKSAVTCANKGDSRKISVLNVTEGGCGVVYNKMGEDKTVAMAKVDMSYCDNVSGKIKSNLEGAGFDCGGGTAAPAETTSGDTQPQPTKTQ